jgi:uncharacterized protein YoxC
MTITEIAAMLAVTIFAVLAGYVVPVLVHLRKTMVASEELLAKMNGEVPLLIAELRAMSQHVNQLAAETRGGVEHAAVLLHALGEIGESVQEVHHVMRGSSGSLLTNVASLMAGFKAATQVVRGRINCEGDPHNGG